MNIRLRGLLQIVVGVGAFLLVFYLLSGTMYSPETGHNYPAVKFAALPLVLVLTGLLELVAGLPFYQIAKKWDSMHGGVRFLLGLVIILVSIPIFVIVWSLLMGPPQ